MYRGSDAGESAEGFLPLDKVLRRPTEAQCTSPVKKEMRIRRLKAYF
jgi:hypothetical protein